MSRETPTALSSCHHMRLTLLLLVSFSGCQRTGAPAPSAPPPQPPAPVSAGAALDAMDTRKPVPLIPMMAHHQKQNMRDHLLAVQEIVLGVATEDFALVEKAAGRIGSSPQMAQMCNHMGSGAPGFTDQALNFHRAADAIAPAAARKDGKVVLSELSKTLATCTACHEAWKQSVVDEATWSAASKTAAPADEAMRHQHEMMLKTMQPH